MSRAFVGHDFYCCKCGNKGMPIIRNNSRLRERLHIKSLYCLHCKEEINHVECVNSIDIENFREKFENGDYEGQWYYDK